MAGPLGSACSGPWTSPSGGRRPVRRVPTGAALFAILAVRANEVVSVDDLVDGLWGDRPPRSATGVVQTYVSTWRHALAGAAGGNHIVTLDKAYRLDLDEDESDLLSFLRLADEGRDLAAAGRPDDARSTLERALGLRRGPVLAGLSERPFHSTAVGPIEDRLDRAVEDWAGARAPERHG